MACCCKVPDRITAAGSAPEWARASGAAECRSAPAFSPRATTRPDAAWRSTCPLGRDSWLLLYCFLEHRSHHEDTNTLAQAWSTLLGHEGSRRRPTMEFEKLFV